MLEDLCLRSIHPEGSLNNNVVRRAIHLPFSFASSMLVQEAQAQSDHESKDASCHHDGPWCMGPTAWLPITQIDLVPSTTDGPLCLQQRPGSYLLSIDCTGPVPLEGATIWAPGIYVYYVQLLSHIQLFVAPWTVAHQAPLFMEFSRQEHCSGLPFPTPGDLPGPGINPGSPGTPAPPTYPKCRFVFYAITAPSSRALKKTDLPICVPPNTASSQETHFMASEVWGCVHTMKSTRLTMYCFPQK